MRSRTYRWFLLYIGTAATGIGFWIIVIGGYLFDWKWTGIANRTLWDWLTLLLPAYIAIIGTYFGVTLTRQQSAVQHEVEERRAQETAVQTYVDQTLSLLANETLQDSQRSEELRVQLRARTRMVLERIDAMHKTIVVRFLHDAGLILGEPPTVRLDGADLRGVILPSEDLKEANLSGANLLEASLNGADLRGADLRGADLGAAKGVTTEQLEIDARTLEGATMPDGQVSWLYSTDLGEDGENSGAS